MRLPSDVLALMRRQLGLVARMQVLHRGVSASTLEGWIADAELEVVQRGVYRRPGTAVPDAQHVLAAQMRAGDRARISGWSACALYGIEGFDIRRAPWIVVPPERRVTGVDFVVQRLSLVRGDIARLGLLPTVTPIRAVIDVAARIGPRASRVAIDDGRRRGLFDLDRLLHRAVELGRHPGAVKIRRLFTTGLLDQDGELERRLALALAAAGLHPAWGMEVLPGIVTDACFPDASYVIECDGVRWHTIDSDRASDVTRAGVLAADGWLVHRVRTIDLRADAAAVVARIRDTRDARVGRGLGRPTGWRPVHAGRRLRPPAA